MTKGRIPSLLSVNCGKPKKSIVKRKSYCRRCKEPLKAEEFCVEIPKRNGIHLINVIALSVLER